MLEKEIENKTIHLLQLINILEQKKNNYKVLPQASLGFPTTDVSHVEKHDSIIKIYAKFMGLYGVDAPLPLFMLQSAAFETEQAEIFRDLLDVFNQRMYQLLFKAWRKSRFLLDCSDGNARYEFYLKFLSGTSLKEALSCAGLFRSYTHPIEGLKKIITNILDWPFVSIVTGLLSWEQVDNKSCPVVLGDNSLLGSSVLFYNKLIHIRIINLSFGKYQQWIKSKKPHNIFDVLKSCVKHYLDIDIKFLIVLVFDTKTIPVLKLGLTLGEASHKLGGPLLLGSAKKPFCDYHYAK